MKDVLAHSRGNGLVDFQTFPPTQIIQGFYNSCLNVSIHSVCEVPHHKLLGYLTWASIWEDSQLDNIQVVFQSVVAASTEKLSRETRCQFLFLKMVYAFYAGLFFALFWCSLSFCHICMKTNPLKSLVTESLMHRSNFWQIKCSALGQCPAVAPSHVQFFLRLRQEDFSSTLNPQLMSCMYS